MGQPELSETSNPLVTVLASAFVNSPESKNAIEAGLVQSIGLRDALTRVFDSDMHCTQYAPVELPITSPREAGALSSMPVKLTRLAVREGVQVNMVALIGDIDGPGHVATPEWRAETEAKIEASGLAWYATRNGYRVLMTLPEPFTINNASEEQSWTQLYRGWCEHVEQTHGIVLDRRCANWDRIFRLPNVRRGTEDARATVQRLDSIPTFDLDSHYIELTDAAPPKSQTRLSAPTDDKQILKARRIAERCEPSLEGLGGDEAHFKAACEIATVLGEDVETITQVLLDTFNPRCDPPWPESRVKREAQRAAERQATPTARYARRLEAKAEAYFKPETQVNDYASFTVEDQSKPPEPIAYIIEDLGIAPGKVTTIQAFANVAKTPFGLLLARCVSSGKDFVGFPVARPCPTWFLAFEGGVLTRERSDRIAWGLGIAPADSPMHYSNALSELSVAFLDDMRSFIEAHQIGMVVIDTYGSAIPGDVDQNSSQFAQWLRELGKLSDELNLTIVVLIHENKSEGAKGLRRISGHNAVPGTIQASIEIARKGDDRNVVDVLCAREVRKAFDPFAIRFKDVPCDRAPTGAALVVERVARTEAPAGLQRLNTAKRDDFEKRVYIAGERIVAHMRGVEGHYLQRDLVAAGGGNSRRAPIEAIARLRGAGLIEYLAQRYVLTDEGRGASANRIATGLGKIGNFYT